MIVIYINQLLKKQQFRDILQNLMNCIQLLLIAHTVPLLKTTNQICTTLLHKNCMIIINYITFLSSSNIIWILLIYRSVISNAEEIFEIDQASWNNFMYVGCYARDIIKYLKQREVSTIFIDDY